MMAKHQKKPPPTAERVRALLHYDPETGVFTWREKRNFAHRLTESAGGITKRTDGRAQHVIVVDGRRCYSQRLAWLLVTGRWPIANVCFRNSDPLDLRFTNLYLDTGAAAQLRHAAPARQTATGIRGVIKVGPTRYQARLKVDQKYVNLGTFDTPECAQKAYVQAKQALRFRGHIPKHRAPRQLAESKHERGPRIAPIDRVRMRAQAMLDRMPPFEQWPGRHMPLSHAAAFGETSARAVYDKLVNELKNEIADPTPTSFTMGPDGKLAHVGY